MVRSKKNKIGSLVMVGAIIAANTSSIYANSNNIVKNENLIPILEKTNILKGNGMDQFLKGCETKDGGYIACGFSSSKNLGFGHKGEGDAILVKYDEKGNQEWFKTFGTTGGDEFRDIKQTKDGGYIAVGELDKKCLLAKYDEKGNQEWFKTFGNSRKNSLQSVKQTKDGGYIVTGYSDDKNLGFPNKGGCDAIIVKYDEKGNQKWINSFGNSESDYYECVIETKEGDYIAVGYTDNYKKGKRYDGIIAKYNEKGNQEWLKSFEGNGGDILNTIIETKDGGFIVGGESDSKDIGIELKGDKDAVLIKYDKQGNQEWLKSFGGNDYDSFQGIYETLDGNYMIVGRSSSDDIGCNIIEDAGIIVKTDSKGNAKYATGIDNKAFRSISRLNDGRFAVSGTEWKTWGADVFYFREGIENKKPSINLKEEYKDKIEIEKGKTDTDFLRFVTATDQEDGDISKNIKVDTSKLDVNKEGEYTITYSVADSEGATTTLDANVKVVRVNKKPFIALKKEYKDKIEIEKGKTNTDFLSFVTATDQEDGDISKDIKVDTSKLNVNKEGEYIITYSVADSEGATTTLDANVKVIKSKELIGEAPSINASDKVIKVGSNFYPFRGITANDKEDGDITGFIKLKYNELDTEKVGDYKIVYTVTDKDNNTVEKSINVKVKDFGEKPVINAPDITLEKGQAFNQMENITATDKEDGDISKNIKVIANNVDVNIPGNYIVEYSVKDRDDNISKHTRNVVIKEIDGLPTIKAKNLKVAQGSAIDLFKDITATDQNGNDISSSIKIEKLDLNINEKGLYHVIYSANDKDGNIGTRAVTIKVVTPPQIIAEDLIIPVNNETLETKPVKEEKIASKFLKLLAINNVSYAEDNTKSNKGFDPLNYATAKDSEDGDISDELEVVSSNVNPNKTGTYTVKYAVTNSNNIKNEKDIAVKVVNPNDTYKGTTDKSSTDDNKGTTDKSSTDDNKGTTDKPSTDGNKGTTNKPSINDNEYIADKPSTDGNKETNDRPSIDDNKGITNKPSVDSNKGTTNKLSNVKNSNKEINKVSNDNSSTKNPKTGDEGIFASCITVILSATLLILRRRKAKVK
ncbi:DUF5011 domain-containing protein [Romboutsia sp. 1001216sp1]|uniref:immunoglobulin-like domain-containing protein n=1 Tax=unclassified Romboutsia TaxID=2626894 RepID=UPI0018A0EC5B|nr:MULTISPECIES: immunoglobulin-like domain-containing protein [unclassified Romboutsia]MDB8803189.1 DUF5011 domain-containing protein [Romboutsia sp. 1001216sp1]MDB8814548.1 DUF5011 domain-containing protein [Romboutsia sp. 1001216sp1]